MRINDLPIRDRPRERLDALGSGALADRELLALLLGTGGSRGVGAHTLAERLLARFGSVAALSRAHPAELCRVAGVGPAKAAALVAAFELARRAAASTPPTVITGAADLARVVAPLLHGRTRERMVVVSCDHANRVIGCDVLSEGSADRTMLPVREAIVTVLRRDGRAFGVAHNHPSGQEYASAADIEATFGIRAAAAAVGLQFIDHVVVTDHGWCSVPLVREPTRIRTQLRPVRRVICAACRRSDPAPRPASPTPRGTDPAPHRDAGPVPRPDADPTPRPDPGPAPRPDPGPVSRPDADLAQRPPSAPAIDTRA